MIYVSARHYQRVQAMEARQTSFKAFSAMFEALAISLVIIAVATPLYVITLILGA